MAQWSRHTYAPITKKGRGMKALGQQMLRSGLWQPLSGVVEGSEEAPNICTGREREASALFRTACTNRPIGRQQLTDRLDN